MIMMDAFNLWFWPFMALGAGIAIVVGIIFFVIWIWAIIDCARRSFKNDVEKIVWLLVIVLGTWVGTIVYFIVVPMSNPRGVSKK